MELKLENGKVMQVNWEQCDPLCPGWLHMDSPYEIEACDACMRFKFIPAFDRDEQARESHSLECGCDWPRVDFQNAAMSWITDLGRHESAQQGLEIDRLHILLDTRGSLFISNIEPALKTCANLVKNSDQSMRTTLEELSELLKKVLDGVEKKKINLKDFDYHFENLDTGEHKNPPKYSPLLDNNIAEDKIIEIAREKLGEFSTFLYNLVHEAKRSEAAFINNEGISSQISYLVQCLGLAPVKSIVFDLIQDADASALIRKDYKSARENSPT